MTPGRLVLLVDDDQDLLVALSGVLRRRGFDVVVAGDAVAAMTVATRHRPQIVVLDVGLPGGEGLLVMRRLHALPQLAGVPVVIMSGRDPGRYRDDAMAAGAVAYLTKPVDTDALVAALHTALGEDPSGGSGAADARQDAGAHAGKLVLLVDDDADLVLALAAPLRRRGFEVAVANDAVNAISAAVKQPPAAVLMDIGLPGGDGIGVMQRLHTMPQFAGLPVLMLTGRDPEQHREQALAAGAAAFLVKPVETDALIAALEQALDPDDGA